MNKASGSYEELNKNYDERQNKVVDLKKYNERVNLNASNIINGIWDEINQERTAS